MSIRVTCPECGKAAIAPDNAAGRKVRCRGCQNVFPIPAGPEEDPPMLVMVDTDPDEAMPDVSDLSLRARALRFLELPQPRGLGDHSMGLGLIRAYAEGDEEKTGDPKYLKVLSTFLLVLRLEGKGGSKECQDYVSEELKLLADIKEELQG
jgi:hypothetical protein